MELRSIRKIEELLRCLGTEFLRKRRQGAEGHLQIQVPHKIIPAPCNGSCSAESRSSDQRKRCLKKSKHRHYVTGCLPFSAPLASLRESISLPYHFAPFEPLFSGDHVAFKGSVVAIFPIRACLRAPHRQAIQTVPGKTRTWPTNWPELSRVKT